MKLLAVDTATDACSAALWIDGELLTRFERAPRRHGRLILPMVSELLAQAQLPLTALDALAFGRGPGAFTGLRIAAGVVQGLAAGAGLGVVPVSDLAALAQPRLDQEVGARVLACLDARMNEFYWGAFAADASGLAEALGPEHLTPADAVRVDGEGWIGVGSGFADGRLAPSWARSTWPDALPAAADIARLAVRDHAAGKTVAPGQAQPVYLRDEVAWRS